MTRSNYFFHNLCTYKLLFTHFCLVCLLLEPPWLELVCCWFELPRVSSNWGGSTPMVHAWEVVAWVGSRGAWWDLSTKRSYTWSRTSCKDGNKHDLIRALEPMATPTRLLLNIEMCRLFPGLFPVLNIWYWYISMNWGTHVWESQCLEP